MSKTYMVLFLHCFKKRLILKHMTVMMFTRTYIIHAHIYPHAYIHIHTYIYTYIHTHICIYLQHMYVVFFPKTLPNNHAKCNTNKSEEAWTYAHIHTLTRKHKINETI